MMIYDMKTEDLINPIGIDEKTPRFSWKLQSKISGTVQTAYRIITMNWQMANGNTPCAIIRGIYMCSIRLKFPYG